MADLGDHEVSDGGRNRRGQLRCIERLPSPEYHE